MGGFFVYQEIGEWLEKRIDFFKSFYLTDVTEYITIQS